MLAATAGAGRWHVAVNDRRYGPVWAGSAGRRGRRPLRREGPGFVIARPVRRLVVAIRNPRSLFPCFQMAI